MFEVLYVKAVERAGGRTGGWEITGTTSLLSNPLRLAKKKTDFFNEPNPSSLGLRIPFPDPHRPLPPVVVDAVVPLAVLGQDGEPLAGLILAAASLLKDTANRIGDLVDDGRVNRSFKS